MSRSNGPGVPPNGWPSDYPPADGQDAYQDPYYAQNQPVQNQRPPQPAPAGARTPRIQPPVSRTPQAGLPAGGLPPAHYPQTGPGQGYAQPQYAPPQQPNPYPQQRYAPQPAPARSPQASYQPPNPPPQPPQGDPRYAGYPGYDASGQPIGQPTARPLLPPQHAYPQSYVPAPAPQAYVPETTARPTQTPAARAPTPYDGWAPPQPQSQAVDPRGYDLGHYMPAPAAEPRTQRPTGQPAWTPEPELARQPASNAPYPAQYGGDFNASNQALEPTHGDEEYDDEHEDYEDPPRKTRYGLIAASVIGAIIAGGGLAYAYKAFVAPQTQTAATPVVKSGTGPVKVKPADPGGTKFANADSKMMDSLSGTPASDPDGAPKAVKTLTIERDGSVAGAPPSAAPATAASPSSAVPGMIIAGLPPPRAPAPAAQPPPQASAPLPQAAAPPLPAAAAPAQKIATAAGPVPAAAAVKPAVKKAVATTPPSAVGGPKGANGFVAVLASVPVSDTSRTQAMQQYADLQQKFGTVLGGKAPDVVDATVKNAPYHRLIVGPPGSRDAASGLCTQLKAAGYTADCWVTAF